MTIKQIRAMVEDACRESANPFGYGIWSHHVVSVVAYSKLLAEQLGADEEIVELAALLHDYAAILDQSLYPEHHMHGARLAEELLVTDGYPRDRAERVGRCIISHRGSAPLPKESLEAEILATADAMAHFDNVSSLLYYTFAKRGMGIDEGTEWVIGKLERDWEKLMPQARELLSDKYEAITAVLKPPSPRSPRS